MTYVMNNPNEAQRLEEQSKNDFFSPERELSKVKLKARGTVLDAGCGSGIFTKAIKCAAPQLQVQGCDIDSKHISYARNDSDESIDFFQHDLLNSEFLYKYDQVFNRYVAHHFNVENYRKILKNFYRALNTGGELVVIDIDGLYANIGSLSKELDSYLSIIHKKFHGDLCITRKIPELLSEIGFKDISWDIQSLDFTKENRRAEIQQWESRIDNGFKFYVDFFGSEFEAQRFKKLYLEEIAKPSVPMFYNKFIITGKK